MFKFIPTGQAAVAVVTVGSSMLGSASYFERNPSFLAWRLRRSLQGTPFVESPSAEFSLLSCLERDGEKIFSRDELEGHLVKVISDTYAANDSSLIVGGPGGIGKSIFWENFLRKRQLNDSEKQGVWARLPGPTRVINLLDCKDLEAFQAQVISLFYPRPYLPSFGLNPPPKYEDALLVLQRALVGLPKESPLVVFIEDINELEQFDEWEASYTALANAVSVSGKAFIVGNASDLLAYINFGALPHAGRRSSTFFFPPLHLDDPALMSYAQNGGHLYRRSNSSSSVDVTSSINVWGSNLTFLRKGTARDEHVICTKVGQALTNVAVPAKWTSKVVPSNASPSRILELRRQLLQQLADSPSPEHELSVQSLSRDMKVLMIAEQLAALNLVTFRSATNTVNEDVIAPYCPAVIVFFKEREKATATAAASASEGCWLLKAV